MSRKQGDARIILIRKKKHKVKIYIINPIDMMSMLIDRYFENEEERSSQSRN